MSSDFESYEQDFAVLTAEITGRIGKVPKLVGDDKKQMVANVEKQLEEARELNRISVLDQSIGMASRKAGFWDDSTAGFSGEDGKVPNRSDLVFTLRNTAELLSRLMRMF